MNQWDLNRLPTFPHLFYIINISIYSLILTAIREPLPFQQLVRMIPLCCLSIL